MIFMYYANRYMSGAMISSSRGKTINLRKRKIQQYNSQMAVSFLTKD